MSDSARLAGRRLWIGIPGPELDPPTRTLLDELRPGGVILFRRNVRDRDQVRDLCLALRAQLGRGLHLAVDQEHGLVTRFHRELTVFPGNMALGAASIRELSFGEHLAREQGRHAARELRDLGLDVNLAPCVDLALTGDNPGLGIRSFGRHPRLVSALAAAIVRGTREGGGLATLKHFPGIGAARRDSHLELPVVASGDQEPHLDPFRAGLRAGAGAVMTSHVVFAGLDPARPATLSPAIVQGLLRESLGCEGVVLTDDLEMGAMREHFGFEEVVRQALAAGHDVLCICHDPDRQRQAHALLVGGLESGAAWWGDTRAVTDRLDAFRTPDAVGGPDREAAAALAEAIAGRAVTVVRDDRGLLPVGSDQRVLLALPDPRRETEVEDPLRGEADTSVLASALGPGVTVHPLRTAPGPGEVDALLEAARDSERLFVVLTNARFIPEQAALARRAVADHPGTVLLAIRSPFDLEVLPPGSRWTGVASYGFRPAQLRALAGLLRGATRPYGRLPVELEQGRAT